MSCLSAASWLSLRLRTRCMRPSCKLSGATPRSFLALASGCTVPLSVTNWDSSMGLTTRMAGAAFCAMSEVEQSNAPASTQRGSVRRFAILGELDPFFEDNPLEAEKLSSQAKNLRLKCSSTAVHCRSECHRHHN